MDKETKQLILVIIAFMFIGLMSILTVATVLKTSVNNKDNDNTETVEANNTEVTESNNGDVININKVILDTDELIIEALDAKLEDRDNTTGIVINTFIKNNLDNRIIVDAVDEYINNSHANLNYYFTMEKQEQINKELFVPIANIDNLKVEFNINVSDSLEQSLMYQSTDITVHFDKGEVTIIKSSSMENKIDEQATENQSVEETEETSDSSGAEQVEGTETTEPNNTEASETNPTATDETDETEATESTEDSEDTEDWSYRYEEKPDIDIEAIEGGKSTLVGDNRFGFYTLPGEFKLIKQEGNYTEYKSSDLITVSFNYREGMTVNDFRRDLLTKYANIYPAAKFEEVDSNYVSALALKETGEIIIKNDETGGIENYSEEELVSSGYTYRLYRYQVASDSGNYIMLTSTSPNPDDIVTIGITVPYELKDYFSHFVNKVVKSYEFIQ